MTNDFNDVELEALLKAAESSEEVDTSGASDQESAKEEVVIDNISSERANERIQELLEENKRLKESPKKAELDPYETPKFKNLDEFVNAIEDEPSRKLLKTYGEILTNQLRSEVAPVLSEHNDAKFKREFDSMVSRVPALSAYEDSLKKSFNRNPNQSIKALVGEVIVDGIFNKVKPIESKGSSPNRTAPDISDASKEDLYSILESMRP
jgi:hypothetical protein